MTLFSKSSFYFYEKTVICDTSRSFSCCSCSGSCDRLLMLKVIVILIFIIFKGALVVAVVVVCFVTLIILMALVF
jgi:hypothetical protein